MSYTSVGIESGSYSETQKPGMIPVADLKVGQKVNCYIDKQSGDDEDGRFKRVLTIESVVAGLNNTLLTFDGPIADEADMVRNTGWVKIEK
jgi:hypothetical protein